MKIYIILVAVLMALSCTACALEVKNPGIIHNGEVFTISNGDTLTLEYDFDNSTAESLSIEAGGLLIVESGSNLIIDGGSVASEGRINNSGGIVCNSHMRGIYNAGSISNSGGIGGIGTIENIGTIESSGGVFSEGYINNSGIIENSGYWHNWVLDNLGTINNSGNMSSQGTNGLNNSGTINNSGSIGGYGGINNAGIINNSGTIEMLDGIYNSGTVNNDGSIIFTWMYNFGILNNYPESGCNPYGYNEVEYTSDLPIIVNSGTVNNYPRIIFYAEVRGNPVNNMTYTSEAPITTCYLTQIGTKKPYNGNINASVKTYSDSIVIELLEPVEAGNINAIQLNLGPECILNITSDNSNVDWIVKKNKGKGKVGFGSMLTTIERASKDRQTVTKITINLNEKCEWNGVMPNNNLGYGIVTHITRLPGNPRNLWLGC